MSATSVITQGCPLSGSILAIAVGPVMIICLAAVPLASARTGSFADNRAASRCAVTAPADSCLYRATCAAIAGHLQQVGLPGLAMIIAMCRARKLMVSSRSCDTFRGERSTMWTRSGAKQQRQDCNSGCASSRDELLSRASLAMDLFFSTPLEVPIMHSLDVASPLREQSRNHWIHVRAKAL